MFGIVRTVGVDVVQVLNWMKVNRIVFIKCHCCCLSWTEKMVVEHFCLTGFTKCVCACVHASCSINSWHQTSQTDCGSLPPPPPHPCAFSCLPDSDGVPGRHNGEIWNLGHGRPGALSQSGSHVLQRCPGGHRGVRHNKWGESGERSRLTCFLTTTCLFL